jgi:hypothetical protein
MARMQFSAKAREKLKHYVYLYIDPRDNRPFYVGKGVGNRCFAHLQDRSESAKAAVIQELKKLGKEPRIEILKYGLTDQQALLVESTAIDLLGVGELTNKVRGHGSRVGSRAGVKELAATLDAAEAHISEPTILININKLFRHGMGEIELYDATRAAWKVSKQSAERVELACSVYRGVIREVYKVAHWLPEGSTMVWHADRGREVNPKRLEFVGRIADEPVSAERSSCPRRASCRDGGRGGDGSCRRGRGGSRAWPDGRRPGGRPRSSRSAGC